MMMMMMTMTLRVSLMSLLLILSIFCSASSAAAQRGNMPRFAATQETEMYIWEMKSRNMTCSALGEPAPIYHWQRNGLRLYTNETFRIFTSRNVSKLQVTVRLRDQAWIYGIYTCVAMNQYGMADIGIDLKRATVPGRPTMVHMTLSMPDSVVITVTPPEDNGGMPVTGYSVQYDRYIYDYNRTTGDEIRIVNLQPSTRYELQVRARNEVGIGLPYTLNIETERVRPGMTKKMYSPLKLMHKAFTSLF